MVNRTSVTFLLAIAATAGVASAQSQIGKQATFTNEKSWQVPGKVLKPGSYQIRIDDTMYDRSILQILEKDGKVLATFLSVPNRALPAQAANNFVFWNGVDDDKQVVRAWVAPGETFAREFVYEKKLAAKIATKANEIVPAVDPSSEPALKGRKLTPSDMKAIQLWALSLNTAAPDKKKEIQAAKLDRSSQGMQAESVPPAAPKQTVRPAAAEAARARVSEPPMAPRTEISRTVRPRQTPAPQPTPMERPRSTPPAAPVAVTRATPSPAPVMMARATPPSRQKLPRTASNMPAIALAGILSFAAGLTLRYSRTRA